VWIEDPLTIVLLVRVDSPPVIDMILRLLGEGEFYLRNAWVLVDIVVFW
jgi:hypothetical protein